MDEKQTPVAAAASAQGQTAPPPAESGKSPLRAALDSVLSRRKFFENVTWFGVGWTAFAAGTAAGLSAMGRFMFPNVLFEPPQSFKVGFPEEFNIGEVNERYKEQGVWVVRTAEGFYALSTVCTHLGCTPNWLAMENKFKCPCHGSGFYRTGINFEGPAPRPLERYRIVLSADGQILVDKNRKFFSEKGQWSDPESFLRV